METTLPQSLMLLALNDETGRTEAGYYQPALAGAAIADLLMREIVELTDDNPPKLVPLRHSQKLGTFLELCDAEIGSATSPQPLDHWLLRLANMKGFVTTLADELVHLGALTEERTKVFGIIDRTVWPEASAHMEAELKHEMRAAMFADEDRVDEKIGILIALARSAGLLEPNFDPAALSQYAERIDRICAGELLADEGNAALIRCVDQVIRAATAMAETSASTIIT